MTFTGSQKVPNIEEMRGVFMILTMKLLKFGVFSKKTWLFSWYSENWSENGFQKMSNLKIRNEGRFREKTWNPSKKSQNELFSEPFSRRFPLRLHELQSLIFGFLKNSAKWEFREISFLGCKNYFLFIINPSRSVLGRGIIVVTILVKKWVF